MATCDGNRVICGLFILDLFVYFNKLCELSDNSNNSDCLRIRYCDILLQMQTQFYIVSFAKAPLIGGTGAPQCTTSTKTKY